MRINWLKLEARYESLMPLFNKADKTMEFSRLVAGSSLYAVRTYLAANE